MHSVRSQCCSGCNLIECFQISTRVLEQYIQHPPEIFFNRKLWGPVMQKSLIYRIHWNCGIIATVIKELWPKRNSGEFSNWFLKLHLGKNGKSWSNHESSRYWRNELVRSQQRASLFSRLLLLLLLLQQLMPLPEYRIAASTVIDDVYGRGMTLDVESIVRTTNSRRWRFDNDTLLLLLLLPRMNGIRKRRRRRHWVRCHAAVVVVGRRRRRQDAGTRRISVRSVDFVNVGVFVVGRAAAATCVVSDARRDVVRCRCRRCIRMSAARDGGVIQRPTVAFRHRSVVRVGGCHGVFLEERLAGTSRVWRRTATWRWRLAVEVIAFPASDRMRQNHRDSVWRNDST